MSAFLPTRRAISPSCPGRRASARSGSASSTVTSNVQTYAISAGIGATNVNFAFIDVNPTIEASIGHGASIHADGAVTVAAPATFDEQASTFGVSAGGLAVGVSLTQVTLAPTVTAAVGDPADSTNGDVTIIADSLSVNASTSLPGSGYSARASSTGSAGALVGVTSTNAKTANNSHMKSFVADGAVLSIAGATAVSAVNTNRQRASADSNSFGLVAAGIATASSSSNTDTEAFIGSNVTIDSGS